MVGSEIISGPGRAPDFAFGASISNGGRHLTALKSAAAGGSISRIVPHIEPPHPVTLPAYLADRVLTEYGQADVRASAAPTERLDTGAFCLAREGGTGSDGSFSGRAIQPNSPLPRL